MKSVLPLTIAAALVLPLVAHAQHAGHVMLPAEPATPPANAETKPVEDASMEGMDHSKMDHSQMQGMDHSKMGQAAVTQVTPIPPVTQADIDAAFPDVHAHHMHGTSINSLWLIDRLEFSDANPGTALGWEASAWIGGDVQRLWLRTEGEAVDGRVEHGDVEVLYGRGVRAWWDVVAGIRQDVGVGPSRTWAAFGVQGLAPYKFEVAATAYVGEGGRTSARVEAEYDTLFTNRLILQWRAEANAYGKADPLAGIGSGLSTLETGLRLRYEVTRQFAPYIGIEHERALGNTADLRRAGGHGASDTRVVAGVRVWF
ncbi:MAG: copper resistance protein B [Thermomonas sp.]